MLIKCSGCAANLRVKKEKIKLGGSSFKCPRCGKILFVQRPEKIVKDTREHVFGQDDKETRGFIEHPSEKVKTKTNNILNFLAVLLMIGVISSVGALLWARIQMGKLGGLDHISVLDNNVYIHFNRTLYHLNSDGKLLNSVKLSDLGIKGRASDIQLLSDGTILIGDWDSRNIKRCNTETLSCYVIAPTGNETLKLPFKFFADESSGQIYIIDTSSHQLLVQDIEGQKIRVLADSKILRFPNDILVDDDGLIHIADTNHHRVVTLKLNGDRAEEIGSPIMGRNSLGRPGQNWPVALTKSTDDNWWVLNADTNMKDADLIIYDKFGEPKHRVMLSENADPLDIAWVGEQVIMTDFRLLRVYKIDPVTKKVRDFGDSAFQAALKNVDEHKQNYRDIIRLAFYILAISAGGAFALFAVLLKNRKIKRAAVSKPVTSRRDTIPHSHKEYTIEKRQLDKNEKEILKNSIRVIWIIWAAMLLSLVVYVLICHLFKDDLWGVVDMGDMLNMLKYVLFAVALVEFVIIYFMRKLILTSTQTTQHATDQYTTAVIVSLALAESIGIYGLVLFFLGSDFTTLYIFNALAASAMIIYRPKMDELKKLYFTMKQNMGENPI
jgi:predicted Zn finger-like uncharacterized protein